MSTSEQIALIQGASRGIGLGFVQQLLQQTALPYRVFATCRSPDKATDLVALQQHYPERLELIALDVSNELSIATAADQLAAHSDKLHLLINCAGWLHQAPALLPEKRLADVNLEQLQQSFAVNAFGPILMAKYFMRFFRHRERAVFANISARVGSISDNRLGGWYAYRAAKAAQNMFTRTMAIEFSRSARSTICVALHPGTTETDLSAPFQANVPAEKLFSVERCTEQLLNVIGTLGPDDHGGFFAWNGETIPW